METAATGTDVDASPVLTVVTIAFQCRDDLATTMASVEDQTRRDFEYIVIDGGSSDGSAELIAACERVDRWVSERDRGIYDAMNKGVSLARGRWVCFMNAGDRFSDEHAVAAACAELERIDPDVLYGDALVDYPDGSQRLWRGGRAAALPHGMIASHQATFARTTDLRRLPFRLQRSASDYEFLLRRWCEGARFHHLGTILARVAAGGLSDVRRVRSVSERWAIVRQCGLGGPALDAYYLIALLRGAASSFLIRWLPDPVTRAVRGFRR